MVDPTANSIGLGPGVEVPAGMLTFTFMRSSGPGGQNVNKVASKARLTVELDGLRDYMPDAAVGRLMRVGKRYLVGETLVIESESERSQLDNRRVCIEKLAAMVQRAMIPPKKRKPTRPTKASKERRITSKRQRSETKQKRGRVGRDEW